MNKRDMVVILALIVIIAFLAIGIFSIVGNNNSSNSTLSNSTAGNNTAGSNITGNNMTVIDATVEEATDSNDVSYSSQSEPEYGSDSYVERWDESQKNNDDWAYLHDQPVKTDDEGHKYKRMYDEEKGESYWYQMN